MTPLRRRMTEDMQVRNFSPHTQDSYVQQVSLFARHFSKSPEVLGPEEIRSYQVYLTNEKKLAPSSILIAVSALRFLYKVTLHREWCLEDIIPTPKRPQKLPIVLSPEEVLQFLSCVQSIKHRAILTVCYAAGLGVSEAVRLESRRYRQRKNGHSSGTGKGQKDGFLQVYQSSWKSLRAWWPVDKPKQWLFPGDRVDGPACQGSVEDACQKAHATLAHFQTGNTPLPSTLFCNPSGGIRDRRTLPFNCCWVIAVWLPRPAIYGWL